MNHYRLLFRLFGLAWVAFWVTACRPTEMDVTFNKAESYTYPYRQLGLPVVMDTLSEIKIYTWLQAQIHVHYAQNGQWIQSAYAFSKVRDRAGVFYNTPDRIRIFTALAFGAYQAGDDVSSLFRLKGMGVIENYTSPVVIDPLPAYPLQTLFVDNDTHWYTDEVDKNEQEACLLTELRAGADNSEGIRCFVAEVRLADGSLFTDTLPFVYYRP